IAACSRCRWSILWSAISAGKHCVLDGAFHGERIGEGANRPHFLSLGEIAFFGTDLSALYAGNGEFHGSPGMIGTWRRFISQQVNMLKVSGNILKDGRNFIRFVRFVELRSRGVGDVLQFV